MPVPSVTLSGEALTGHVVDNLHAMALAQLPKTVKLGRKPPTKARQNVPYLEDFLLAGQTLPSSTNWRQKAATIIARMYLNDQYGDCVIASNIHLLGTTSANDADAQFVVQATDAEVLSQYHAICGSGDNGCVIESTLRYGMTTGWLAGGKRYKIDGYCQLNWTAWDLVRAAICDFGGFKIGINLPEAWTSSAVWDVTNTRIVGGHDVLCVDYDDTGVYVASWGRVYKITKAAFLSTRWLEEAYVVLAPTWYGSDKVAPSRYDFAGLQAAMAALKQGQLPEEPGNEPPPPPPPGPTPQQFVVNYPGGTFPVVVTGPFGRPLQGSVTIPGATLPVVEAHAALEARDWQRIIQAILNGARFLCPLVPLLATFGVSPVVIAQLKLACSLVPPTPQAESPCGCD